MEAVPLALPLSIGRDANCTLRLAEDDVSRFHATLERRGDALVLVDNGSRNGVYLDGRRVGQAALSTFAVVRIGQTVLWLAPAERPALRLRAAIAAAAAETAPLLIVGEAGAGRKSAARKIHHASRRAGPLVVVEGAPDTRVWDAAAGGTVLCLAGDFDAIVRAGASRDVRLLGIAAPGATSAAARLEIPPLRERLDELASALAALLVRAGAARATFDADLVEALACHPFPLNFAELEVLARELARIAPPLGIAHLPPAVRARIALARTAAPDLSRERLHDALARHKGNVRRVAHELRVARGQLYRLLAAFGLNPDVYRAEATPTGEERRTL